MLSRTLFRSGCGRFGGVRAFSRLHHAEGLLSPGIARLTPCTFVKGRGSLLWDEEGNEWLDFACGIGVTNTGHCHPKVVAAVQKQAAELVHLQANMGYHKPMLELAEKLARKAPEGLDSVFFANSGSEAVENALKAARMYTKKQNVIVFQGGFHGRTIGAMSMTTSKTSYRAGFGPLMPQVFVAPFPYCLHCPGSASFDNDECCGYAIEQLELLFKQQTAPEETAAIIVEPVLGEGGYVFPPYKFYRQVREICDKFNVLFIADEVQTGFGRTGKMFAIEHYDVVPDIITAAKGLASGYPLSAVITSRKIMAAQPAGSMGGTYGGNVVACAAANATIDAMEEEKMLQNAEEQGERLRSGLESLRSSYPIRDVRGKGLMYGVEFNDDCEAGTAGKISKAAAEQRMLLLTASAFETLRFIPPLVVTSQEIDRGLHVFEESMKKVFK